MGGHSEKGEVLEQHVNRSFLMRTRTKAKAKQSKDRRNGARSCDHLADFLVGKQQREIKSRRAEAYEVMQYISTHMWRAIALGQGDR
jgi:hypothetical protein